MSEIKSINLNTLYCSNQYQTNYLSNPSWILPESIENINSFKLNDFTIPLSIYNIDNRNNILSLTQGTNGPFIITIPSKNYTGLSIASSLTTALNSAGSGFNVNYQTDGSNLLTIGSTSGSFKFNTVNTGNDIYYELGLKNSLNTLTSSITSGSIDMSGMNSLIIASNIGGATVIGSNFKILASIPTQGVSLSISTYQNSSDDYINLNTNLTEIQLRLYDQRFRTIIPNKDFSLTLNFKCD